MPQLNHFAYMDAPEDYHLDESQDLYGASLLEENYPWYLATALATVCHGFSLLVAWPWLI